MRLWLELYPPTDKAGVLAAWAQRDLLLWRGLLFMQRYPLVVMPTMSDLAPPQNLELTREGHARLLDSARGAMISRVLGIPAPDVPVGAGGRFCAGVQILAPRFREDLCLDAGEVIETAKGVVAPVDPVASPAAA
jgi:amidase